MSSTGVNVLRWGALVFGVFYAFSHQTQISSRERQRQLQHDYDRKAKLIDEAKKAWVEKTMPQDKRTKGGSIITDPMDPKFDLEAYLTKVQAES